MGWISKDFSQSIGLSGCQSPGEMREVFLGKVTDERKMTKILKEPWFAGNKLPAQFEEERIISFFERMVRSI
jgi:hypothetical protein